MSDITPKAKTTLVFDIAKKTLLKNLDESKKGNANEYAIRLETVISTS